MTAAAFASDLRRSFDDARRRRDGRWRVHRSTWLRRYPDEAHARELFDRKEPLAYAAQVRGAIRKHWAALGGPEGILAASGEHANVLATLPYWPVGVDDAGAWVLSAPPLPASTVGLFEASIGALGRELARANGVVGHPRVLGAISQTWLLADAVHRATGGVEWRPDLVLGERLLGKHDELADALASLPYLPVGLDEHDRWI